MLLLLTLTAVLLGAPAAAAPERAPQPHRIAAVPGFDSLGLGEVERRQRAEFAALVERNGLRIVAEPVPERRGRAMGPGHYIAAYLLEARGAPLEPAGDARLAALLDHPLVTRLLPLWSRDHALTPRLALHWAEGCADGLVARGKAQLRAAGFEIDPRTPPGCTVNARWPDPTAAEALPRALHGLGHIEGSRLDWTLLRLLTDPPTDGPALAEPAPARMRAFDERAARGFDRLRRRAVHCPPPLSGPRVTALVHFDPDGPPRIERLQPEKLDGSLFAACLQRLVAAEPWPRPRHPRVRALHLDLKRPAP